MEALSDPSFGIVCEVVCWVAMGWGGMLFLVRPTCPFSPFFSLSQFLHHLFMFESLKRPSSYSSSYPLPLSFHRRLQPFVIHEQQLTYLPDPKNAHAWPPLLFLSELYAQALITMGDDEFFGTSSSSSSSSYANTAILPSSSSSSRAGGAVVGETVQARNPLSLDEVASLARQMLGIAFTLYWVEEGGVNGDRGVAGAFLSSFFSSTVD
jgi:hypothetical protein